MDPNYKIAKFIFYSFNLTSVYLLHYFKTNFPFVVYICLLVLNIFFYEKCAVDPGIVDPSKHIVQIELEDLSQDNQDYDYPDQHFCDICKVIQYYRTKHCNICGVCIYKYDHHCFWIGSCIGELNQKYFIIFIYLQNSLAFISFFEVICVY